MRSTGGRNTTTTNRARIPGVIASAKSLENRSPAALGVRARHRPMANIATIPSRTTSSHPTPIANTCQSDQAPTFTIDSS